MQGKSKKSPYPEVSVCMWGDSFSMILPQFLIFINIHEYANEIIIYDYLMKGLVKSYLMT